MRTLLPTLLALTTMMMLAPLAMAEEAKGEEDPRPDDAAWVEDCPPDMMCAMSDTKEPEDEDKPTYDGDCGGEVCAYDGAPQEYGPGDCIECSGPAEGGETCMDGADANETCRDDVQYLDGGPTRGPADGSCENCRGDDAGAPEPGVPTGAPADAETHGAETKPVPVPSALALLAIGAALVFAAIRRS